MVRVIGIDPGSRLTGYGVIEVGSQGLIYLASGCIRTGRGPFAERLAEQGADVVREGASYEESMAAAAAAAEANGWALLSDSSWPGYFERPHRLMESRLR